jgi:hypothetical protein
MEILMYVYVTYLKTLLGTQVYRKLHVWMVVNCKQAGYWRKRLSPNLRYSSENCLKGLRKSTKCLNQVNRVRYSKWEPPSYKTENLSLNPTFSIILDNLILCHFAERKHRSSTQSFISFIAGCMYHSSANTLSQMNPVHTLTANFLNVMLHT